MGKYLFSEIGEPISGMKRSKHEGDDILDSARQSSSSASSRVIPNTT